MGVELYLSSDTALHNTDFPLSEPQHPRLYPERRWGNRCFIRAYESEMVKGAQQS